MIGLNEKGEPVTIVAHNPDHALVNGVWLLRKHGTLVSPRGAETLEMNCPVLTTFTQPLHRVIFNPARNANPFFHLMEALWILAGRRDVRWLALFNKRMVNYSDDGETFHAPYGYRIKDQVSRVVDLLRNSPDSRRAVLQIWDHTKDLNHDGLDLPCNDLVFLKVRDGELHIRVCCRSNDMLWGAYGANVVQFSFLQEYLAVKIGVDVGTYTQISDSFHVYTQGAGGLTWDKVRIVAFNPADVGMLNRYHNATPIDRVQPTPLLWNGETIDTLERDIIALFSTFDLVVQGNDLEPLVNQKYDTFFFDACVVPMMLAWNEHKRGNTEWASAYLHDHHVEFDLSTPLDWITAGAEWLDRAARKKGENQ